MPQASTIIVTDGVTPITMTPQRVDNGDAFLVNKDEAFIEGQETLQLIFNPITAKRKTDRVTINFNDPKKTLDANSNDVVNDVARAQITLVVPAALTVAERTLFIKRLASVLDDAVVQGYVTNRDPLW